MRLSISECVYAADHQGVFHGNARQYIASSEQARVMVEHVLIAFSVMIAVMTLIDLLSGSVRK